VAGEQKRKSIVQTQGIDMQNANVKTSSVLPTNYLGIRLLYSYTSTGT